MNLAAVTGLPVRPITTVWYRALDPQHLPTALGYAHTIHFPSRYSEGPNAAKPFPILYLAENQSVALFEVEALYGSPLVPGGVIANPKGSWIVLNVHVNLSRVADLTAVAPHISLATTAQELTGDWRAYRQRNAGTSIQGPVGSAPTQELGAAIHADGSFEGFATISSKQPYSMILGVLPDRIAQGSFINYSYVDSAGVAQNHRIP